MASLRYTTVTRDEVVLTYPRSAPRHDAPPPGPSVRFGRTDLALLLVVAMWGTNFSVLKVGLEHVSPLFFASSRFVLALAVMVPLAWLAGEPLGLGRGDRLRAAAAGLLGNGVYMLLFVNGAARTSAANAAMILATVPVWVALIADRAGIERFGRRGWPGVALALGGVVLIVTGGERGPELGHASRVGDLLVLLATLAWSGYTVLIRPLVLRASSSAVTIVATASGTLPLVLLTLPFVSLEELRAIPARGWTSLVVSALIGIAIPYFIWSHGVQRLGSARTALYSYLTPLVALVVSRLWLGERLAPRQWLGGVLVLSGVVLARRFMGREA